jgi:hypothetical protein
MSASAFRATYSDWRLVKSRGVVQVVMEVPLADADKAYEILGGMPNPAAEQWFGIAAIRADRSGQAESMSTARTTRAWKDMLPQQQAGIRCDEVTFAVFLHEEYPEEWHEAMDDPAEAVRLICGVQSRAEFSTNAKAAVAWRQLDDKYQAWRTVERVA